VAEGERSPRQLLIIGVVGGLIGIYLANYLNSMTGTAWFSFFAALGAVLAVFWGADAVRRVASYGLGTGVPSIGLLSLGAGQVAVLLGLVVLDEPLTVGVMVGFPLVLAGSWLATRPTRPVPAQAG